MSACFVPQAMVADQDNRLSWNVCSPSDESHHLNVRYSWSRLTCKSHKIIHFLV